jgi:hypothetical protein
LGFAKNQVLKTRKSILKYMEQATSLHRDIDIELPASSAKHPHEDVKDATVIVDTNHGVLRRRIYLGLIEGKPKHF